jgi:hypothetical protein
MGISGLGTAAQIFSSLSPSSSANNIRNGIHQPTATNASSTVTATNDPDGDGDNGREAAGGQVNVLA